MNVKSIIKNQVICYMASRYATYALQFVSSLIIAAKLGPYYMGVWGFILLVLQYCQQLHFGFVNSFNVLYVQNRYNERERENYSFNTLFLVSVLAILVVGTYVLYCICGFEPGEKYNLKNYAFWVCIIAVLQHYMSYIVNLFRVKNKIWMVSLSQSTVVLFNFICVFFAEEELLITLLIAGYILGNMLCILVAILTGCLPSFHTCEIKTSYIKKIANKGIFLFLYNTGFYFIVLSVRTIVSGNYSVDEFGMFTFSFSIAHAFMLLLESLSFIVFPKIVGKLSEGDAEHTKNAIKKYRTCYVSTAHILIYVALIFFPVITYLLPKYEAGLTSMNLIALTVLINTNGAGFADLLIARNKERVLTLLALSALVLNVVLALVLVNVIQVGFSYVILATTVTYFVYSIAVAYNGLQLLGSFNSMDILNIAPVRLMVPYICALIISAYEMSYLTPLPIIVFLILNKNEVKEIIIMTKNIIHNPNIINL